MNVIISKLNRITVLSSISSKRSSSSLLLLLLSLKKSSLYTYNSRRLLSYNTYDIKQGGTLEINNLNNQSNIKIISGWRDHVEIDNNNDIKINHDINNNSLIITTNNKINNKINDDICIRIPEVFNIELEGKNSNITLCNKIHGDVAIKIDNGNIILDKVRGSNINIFAGKGNVIINKLLEGNIKLEANKLKAKMINGDIIDLNILDTINIEAMYSKKSYLNSTNNINIGIIHGQTNINCHNGDINIEGIDGSFDIINNEGNIKLQINKVKLKSEALSKKGNIIVSVDPEIVTNVYLKSLSSNISIISDAIDFQQLYNNNNDNTIIEGKLTGKSRAAKRPIFNRGTSLSGKINLEGADLQSMQTIIDDDNENTLFQTKIDSSIKLIASNNIKLETLSWIEAIRRRHGLGDKDITKPPKNVGRTASAKLRVAELIKKVDDK